MMASHAQLILVINCGSSSLKFALYSTDQRGPLLSGLAECLGQADASMRIDADGARVKTSLDGANHAGALAALTRELDARGLLKGIAAVGHRVVHGGERFTASALITPDVIAGIEACVPLAPLHNPANLIGIKAAIAALPGVRQVAVFDTAFHQTMPKAAYLYALPLAYYRDLGVRRYGFHGTSHRYVAAEAVRELGLDPLDHGIVIAHLGNGASATAVLNGRSVDTTMGLTPLEGLVMGTRAGDVDFGALLYIARRTGVDLDGLDTLLNRKSGLLGLSELSNDCRTLVAAAEEGNQQAADALDVFVHRLARHIGGLATSLPRLDAVIFTGGIGENSAPIRAKTLGRLKSLGIELDADANAGIFGGKRGLISTGRTPAALVVPTDEEWMIAEDTADLAGLKAEMAAQ
ncbi:acetate/propionate family kinase [Oryzibacter oryziterrae]|uniref:acetate/propionate family kinase n=1 Tax=Oryzibacter oryziterrae TaxID=2766474 RepID=UPI00272D3A59|nr:acetate kinase [Oryzibacter oryziterrae]